MKKYWRGSHRPLVPVGSFINTKKDLYELWQPRFQNLTKRKHKFDYTNRARSVSIILCLWYHYYKIINLAVCFCRSLGIIRSLDQLYKSTNVK